MTADCCQLATVGELAARFSREDRAIVGLAASLQAQPGLRPIATAFRGKAALRISAGAIGGRWRSRRKMARAGPEAPLPLRRRGGPRPNGCRAAPRLSECRR